MGRSLGGGAVHTRRLASVATRGEAQPRLPSWGEGDGGCWQPLLVWPLSSTLRMNRAWPALLPEPPSSLSAAEFIAMLRQNDSQLKKAASQLRNQGAANQHVPAARAARPSCGWPGLRQQRRGRGRKETLCVSGLGKPRASPAKPPKPACRCWPLQVPSTCKCGAGQCAVPGGHLTLQKGQAAAVLLAADYPPVPPPLQRRVSFHFPVFAWLGLFPQCVPRPTYILLPLTCTFASIAILRGRPACLLWRGGRVLLPRGR